MGSIPCKSDQTEEWEDQDKAVGKFESTTTIEIEPTNSRIWCLECHEARLFRDPEYIFCPKCGRGLVTKTEYEQYRLPQKRFPPHLHDNPRLSEMNDMSEMMEYEQIFPTNHSDVEDSTDYPDVPVMPMSQESVNDMLFRMKQLRKQNAKDPAYSEEMDKLSQDMMEAARRQKQVIDAANNRTPSASSNNSLRSTPAWVSSDLSNPNPRGPGTRGRPPKQKIQIMKRKKIQSDDEIAKDMGGAATSIADSDTENQEEEFKDDLP